MTQDLRDILHEILELWPAYQELHVYLGGDPLKADPRDLIGKVAAHGHDRCVSLLHMHCIGDTWPEAAAVLAEVLVMAAEGRRPRFGHEVLGVTGP